MNRKQASYTKHRITTVKASDKTTLIFVDGKLLMVTSLADPDYEEVVSRLVGSMMHTVFSHGVKAAEVLAEGP